MAKRKKSTKGETMIYKTYTCSGRVGSSCSTSGTRRVNPNGLACLSLKFEFPKQVQGEKAT
jgi:hypothetical protein